MTVLNREILVAKGKRAALMSARTVATPALKVVAARTTRTVSAMIRVRDEEEYLERAVESIVDLVDEVVVVDNLSADKTPAIIAALRERHPSKIRAYEYPHEVARQGEENLTLGSTWRGRRSPRLLANYYNWCLARCTMGMVLKWDGDMVATPALADAMQVVATAKPQILVLTGVNLHEDRRHLIAGRPVEDPEPRIFARRLAWYDNGFDDCERLVSPYERRFPGFKSVMDRPVYVHMKYCKEQRFTSMSADMVREQRTWIASGPVVDAETAQTVERWGL